MRVRAREKCLIREIRRDLFYRYDAFDEERWKETGDFLYESSNLTMYII